MILNRGIDPLELPFTIGDLARLRLQVTRRAVRAGLAEPRLSDFVLAVHEVASNAIVHGGGKGHILLDRTAEGLRCVITDDGPGLVPPAAGACFDDEAEHGRGLWLAEALTDRLEVTAGDCGTTVTLVALLP
ncbi:ATP-binding protein [Streptomyces sp. NPDC050658]|uniref:ATP-binding protein n=1 Tax=unclassified Streptomyces TaxID=2593676 RepID=UPI003445018E